jgi:hypothetical protein
MIKIDKDGNIWTEMVHEAVSIANMVREIRTAENKTLPVEFKDGTVVDILSRFPASAFVGGRVEMLSKNKGAGSTAAGLQTATKLGDKASVVTKRILQHMRANGDMSFNSRMLHESTKIRRDVCGDTMRHLARDGHIRRLGRGVYIA